MIIGTDIRRSDVANKRFAYISGALSDMTEEERVVLRALYERLAEACRTYGLDAYVPHLVSDPAKAPDLTPKDVDRLDREAVTSSCLVIAYVGRASTGLGIEVEMAFHANRPVVILYEKERFEARRISRLIRGNPAVVEEISFYNVEEAIMELKVFLRRFSDKRREDTLPELLRV
jgi:hypothetical protein